MIEADAATIVRRIIGDIVHLARLPCMRLCAGHPAQPSTFCMSRGGPPITQRTSGLSLEPGRDQLKQPDGRQQGAGHVGILLGKGGGDEGSDDAPALLAGMRQDIAHEVHSAALQDACSILATAALSASWESEITSLMPRRASLRRNSVQKVSASEALIAMPNTSRRPSLLTETATITATETMRPFSRAFT
jgi:hypothetical protein